MSQTVIPLQFEQYLQEKINAGYGPDMNEMIFAYIPGLDLAAPIDRATGLPDPSTWVHQQDIDQEGKVGESAIAYSVVIPSSTPEFTFNAIYLHDKNVPNSCGVIVHKISETKEDGMSSTKSLLQAYSGAAALTGITVDAATWQIDYQARLSGIDEDHRLSCLDSYGEVAFIDGFKVTKQGTANQYLVTAGVAYIGGLRAITEDDISQVVTTKPSAIYIDVYRDGSALSSYINNVAVFTSAVNVTNYIDEQGKKHFVAKVAEINADGSVADNTSINAGALERSNNNATASDIDEEKTTSKHVKLDQFWRGIDKKISKAEEGLEPADNAATNDDIDNGSTASKHVKLGQFWRGIDKKINPKIESAKEDMTTVVTLFNGIAGVNELTSLSEPITNFLFVSVILGDGTKDLDTKTIPVGGIDFNSEFTSIIADVNGSAGYTMQQSQFSFVDSTHIKITNSYEKNGEKLDDGTVLHAIRKVIGTVRVN